MATKVPYFHSENWTEFRVWCAMAYRQGFMLVYMARISMFVQGRAKVHQSIKHVDACCIHEETNVTLDEMDQDNHTAMIMNRIWHEYGPTTNDMSAYPPYKDKSTHDHERVTLLTVGVHHTKCMITHKQVDIHTHTHIYIYIYICIYMYM